MGSKLSNSEKMKSLGAVHDFQQSNGWHAKFNATVLAEKTGTIFFNSKVDVVVSDYRNYYNVNISWEDNLSEDEDYHELGLFGYYSTDYCRMRYSSGALIIHSDNNVKITIIC